MILTNDMNDLIELFNTNNVEYALVGGFAVNYYGYIRSTQDIDFLIYPSKSNAEKTVKALNDFGFSGDDLLEYFLEEGTALHLGIAPNRIDLLTNLNGISNVEIFENVTIVNYKGKRINIISLEALIKCKEYSNRKHDQADAEKLKQIKLKQKS